jgi:hypothetical protein
MLFWRQEKAMKSILSLVLAGIFLTSITIAAAAQSSPDVSFRVAEAGSCRSWFNTCAERCGRNRDGREKCTSDHCAPKLAGCQSTGCWQEGKNNGGGLHCGLAK